MINHTALEQVEKNLKNGIPLNLKMIGNIFVQEFWELFVLCVTGNQIVIDKNKATINVNYKK